MKPDFQHHPRSWCPKLAAVVPAVLTFGLEHVCGQVVVVEPPKEPPRKKKPAKKPKLAGECVCVRESESEKTRAMRLTAC